jgi:hypothetical protein
MKRDLEAAEIFTARIRALQGIYAAAHGALRNWGAWSRDLRGLKPTVAPPGMWSQYKPTEADDYGDEMVGPVLVTVPAKSEGPDHELYDERTALILDERMHGPGGLPQMMREAMKIAYVTLEVPEQQFPRLAGCNDDAFCERLETCLLFVGRFVP